MLKRVLRKFKRLFFPMPVPVQVPTPLRPVDHWFAANGDKTLRIQYPDLPQSSIIFDLGGYEGQWASDIFSSYPTSRIYIFEPVLKQVSFIQNRFEKNSLIEVLPYGLGPENVNLNISVNDNCSSLHATFDSGKTEEIMIKSFSEFVHQKGLKKIDLLKINIEGAEFDLLEDLIKSKLIQNVHNVQVQFHDFFPDAKARREKIREQLRETHNETWCYEFVWENWRIKQ